MVKGVSKRVLSKARKIIRGIGNKKRTVYKRKPRFVKRKKRTPSVNNGMAKHTHTMLIQSGMATPKEDGTNIFASQAFDVLVRSNDLNDPYYALQNMMKLSSKHAGLNLSPLIIDLSKERQQSFFTNIKAAITSKHRTYRTSLTTGQAEEVPSPRISFTGIKIKVLPRNDHMKEYIPCCGVQAIDNGALEFITFVQGKLYIKCKRIIDPDLFTTAQVNAGVWPQVLILGNIYQCKVKVYYRTFPLGQYNDNGQAYTTSLAAIRDAQSTAYQDNVESSILASARTEQAVNNLIRRIG